MARGRRGYGWLRGGCRQGGMDGQGRERGWVVEGGLWVGGEREGRGEG